jgi:hypothetical protein
MENNIWNTKLVTSECEGKLVSFLEMDLVRDWEHLKALINRI